MTENVETAMFEILKRIQEDIASLRKEMREGFERSDELARKQRRDNAGMLVMMKSVAGDFDGRMVALVARMDELEARRS